MLVLLLFLVVKAQSSVCSYPDGFPALVVGDGRHEFINGSFGQHLDAVGLGIGHKDGVPLSQQGEFIVGISHLKGRDFFPELFRQDQWREFLFLGVVNPSSVADDVDFVVGYLVHQGDIAVEAGTSVGKLVHHQEASILSCTLVESEKSFGVDGNQQFGVREVGHRNHLVAVCCRIMSEFVRFRMVKVDASAIGSYPEQSVFLFIKAGDGSFGQSVRLVLDNVLIRMDMAFLHADGTSAYASYPQVSVVVLVQADDGIGR